MSQTGKLPLRDLPPMLNLDPKRTIELVEQARSLGQVSVYVLSDPQNSKVLVLTSEGYGTLSGYPGVTATSPES